MGDTVGQIWIDVNADTSKLKSQTDAGAAKAGQRGGETFWRRWRRASKKGLKGVEADIRDFTTVALKGQGKILSGGTKEWREHTTVALKAIGGDTKEFLSVTEALEMKQHVSRKSRLKEMTDKFSDAYQKRLTKVQEFADKKLSSDRKLQAEEDAAAEKLLKNLDKEIERKKRIYEAELKQVKAVGDAKAKESKESLKRIDDERSAQEKLADEMLAAIDERIRLKKLAFKEEIAQEEEIQKKVKRTAKLRASLSKIKVEVDQDRFEKSMKGLQKSFDSFKTFAKKSGRAAGELHSKSFMDSWSRRAKFWTKTISFLGPELVAALGGIGGGLVGAIGAIGQMSAALGAASSMVVGLGLAAGVLGIAFKGLMSDTAKLGPNAKAMVKEFKELKKEFEGIQKAVRENLFANMAKPFSDMKDKVLPQFKKGLEETATTLNGVFQVAIERIGGFDWAGLFSKVQPGIEAMGLGAVAIGESFMSFSGAASDAGNRISLAFQGAAERMRDYINSAEGQEKINEVLQKGIDTTKVWWDTLKPFGQGLQNIFSIGGDAMTKFVGEGQGIGQMFKDWTESAEGTAVIEQFFTNAMAALKALGPAVEGLGKGLALMFTESTVASLESLSTGLGDMFVVVGQLFSELGKANVIGTFGDLLSIVAQAVQPIIPLIGEMATIIGGALGKAMEMLAPHLLDIGILIGDLLKAVMPLIPVLLDALLPVFDALIHAIMPLLPPIVELANVIVAVLTPIIGPLGKLLATIAPILVQLFIAFNPVLRVIQLLSNVMPMLEPYLVFFSEILGDIFDWVARMIQPFVDFIAKMIELVSGGKAVTAIFDKIKDALAIFKNMLGVVNGVVGNFVGSVINFFKSIPSAVKGVIDNVIDFFMNMPSRIIGFVRTIPGMVVVALGGIVASVGGIVDNIVDFFKKLPGRLLSAMGDIGKKIVDKITGSIPASLKKFIPGFASGGIVYGPTRALVGEAGPEAIIPLTRPLSQIDPSVRAMAALLRQEEKMFDAGIGSATRAAQVNTFNITTPAEDPATVARQVVNRIAALSR